MKPQGYRAPPERPNKLTSKDKTMKQQYTVMKYDPATGEEKPYPSHAEQWREWNKNDAFLFNPWTGQRRFSGDVGTDPHGYAILPPGEPVFS